MIGEIAEDIVKGLCCSLCGMYFREGPDEDPKTPLFEHGYPAVCVECWEDLTAKERRLHVRAAVATFGGEDYYDLDD